MTRCYKCHRTGSASLLPPSDDRPRKQLHLGPSHDGQLCVLPPNISVSSEGPKEPLLGMPFITRISDELLDEIFVHAIKSSGGWGVNIYHTALALSQVSKRFHRIVQPLMYRTIQLGEHSLVRPCRVVKQLHMTIKCNPALGSMVRTLRAHVEWGLRADYADADFQFASELLGWLPNVESFDLQGGFEHPLAWPMISNAVKNWPRLKCLLFSREDWTLKMPPICDLVLTTPSLMTLNLHGPGAPTDRNLCPLWMPPSKDAERSSNITKLIISDFGERPEALHRLLKLPRALEHFAFEKIYANPVRWRLDMFQWLLADHKHTIKSLEFGSLSSEYTPINLLDFSNLETLNLSHWGYKETPEVAAATILAPRLHTFIWDFNTFDQDGASWSDFGKEQKEWLLKFAELAAEKKSALRRIQIVFCPVEYEGPQTREEIATCVSPWDLMNEVRDKIRPLGIELEYGVSWTREGGLQRNERDETFHMSGDEEI